MRARGDMCHRPAADWKGNWRRVCVSHTGQRLKAVPITAVEYHSTRETRQPPAPSQTSPGSQTDPKVEVPCGRSRAG